MSTLTILPQSAQADTTTETSLTSDSAQATDSSSTSFLTLLANHLNQASEGAETEPVDLTSGGKTKSTRADITDDDLSQILSQPENLQALNMLLEPARVNIKDGADTVDDSKKQDVTSLSSRDAQTLQALLAMLPQNHVAMSPQPTAISSNDTVSATEGGDTRQTISSLFGNTSILTTRERKQNQHTTDGDLSLSALTPAQTGQDSQTEISNATANMLNSVAQAAAETTDKTAHDKHHEVTAAHATPLNTLPAALASAAGTPDVQIAASTSTTLPVPQLSSQLGSPEWQQALGQQVLLFSRNGQHAAELRLHPEDLGSIQISLKLDNDQAQLNMISGHSQVRAALEAAMPHLRTALAESGISLGQSSVSSDAFAQNQSAGGQQQSQQNNSNPAFHLMDESSDRGVALDVPVSLQAQAAGPRGSVDIFA